MPNQLHPARYSEARYVTGSDTPLLNSERQNVKILQTQKCKTIQNTHQPSSTAINTPLCHNSSQHWKTLTGKMKRLKKCNSKHVLHTLHRVAPMPTTLIMSLICLQIVPHVYSFLSHSLHASPSVVFPTSPFLLPEIFGSQPQSVLFAFQDFTQKPSSTFYWIYLSHKISFTFTFVLTSIFRAKSELRLWRQPLASQRGKQTNYHNHHQ